MSKNVRTVRFDDKQIKRIEEFLVRNPFLDFSSLTRLAIDQFVQNPTVQIQPIVKGKNARHKEREM
ncbi:hypothetical protein AZI85_17215 [Bdellovibrio bacteriovorus]|uniref:Uncharacterized protein n=1 Tax=Bdellovibrio bacteriovorus TaxID=959 RepID=A0A150WTF7_BDEBC|nr:hypothetical protein AZI85_17215 [Bdellovibrio bacteriovorus]